MVDPSVVERAQISGRAVASIFGAFGAFPILAAKYLADEGIGVPQPDGSVQVDPGAFYPLSAWLRVLRRLEKDFPPRVLKQVGVQIMSARNLPPGLGDIRAAFGVINAGYHAGHVVDGRPMFDPRTNELTGGIGGFETTSFPHQNLLLVRVDTPAPCAVNEGSVGGLAHLFEKEAEIFHEPESCRAKGGASCTYRVTWPAG